MHAAFADQKGHDLKKALLEMFECFLLAAFMLGMATAWLGSLIWAYCRISWTTTNLPSTEHIRKDMDDSNENDSLDSLVPWRPGAPIFLSAKGNKYHLRAVCRKQRFSAVNVCLHCLNALALESYKDKWHDFGERSKLSRHHDLYKLSAEKCWKKGKQIGVTGNMSTKWVLPEHDRYNLEFLYSLMDQWSLLYYIMCVFCLALESIQYHFCIVTHGKWAGSVRVLFLFRYCLFSKVWIASFHIISRCG